MEKIIQINSETRTCDSYLDLIIRANEFMRDPERYKEIYKHFESKSVKPEKWIELIEKSNGKDNSNK